jgi:hypothetical protein
MVASTSFALNATNRPNEPQIQSQLSTRFALRASLAIVLYDVAENEYITTRCAGGTKARRRKTKLCVSVPPVTEGNEWFEKSGTMREKGLDQSTPIGQSGSYIQSELVNPIHAAGHPTTLTNPKLTGWGASPPRSVIKKWKYSTCQLPS